MNKIDEIQEKIDQLQKELDFEIARPKAGWYRYKDFAKYLMYINEDGSRFGFDARGDWLVNPISIEKGEIIEWHGFERATDVDVLKVMSRIVLDTKYREGVCINSLRSNGEVQLNNYKLEIKGDQIRLGGCDIMKAGKWAEILPPKLGGHVMVQRGDRISFGKTLFTKDQLKKYYELLTEDFPLQSHNHNIGAVDIKAKSIVFSNGVILTEDKLGAIIDYMK